jgi:hypothetical protein
MELKDFWSTTSPPFACTFSVDRLSIMALATSSLVRDQMSTTLL